MLGFLSNLGSSLNFTFYQLPPFKEDPTISSTPPPKSGEGMTPSRYGQKNYH